MRTTVTIDDDIALRIEQRRAERGQSFKDAINDMLRIALDADEAQVRRREERSAPLKTFSLGQPYLNLDNIGEVLAILDGEDYK